MQLSCKEAKSDVEGFVVLTLMEEGELAAQTTAPPGFRLFEIFRQHHWSGTYYTEDGFIVPPDRPIFEFQIIHLDDPTKKKETMEIELFTPTEEVHEAEEIDRNHDFEESKLRIQTLFKHGGVGDDEMQFYLLATAHLYSPLDVYLYATVSKFSKDLLEAGCLGCCCLAVFLLVCERNPGWGITVASSSFGHG